MTLEINGSLWSGRWAGWIWAAVAAVAMAVESTPVSAQPPPVHYFHAYDLPPGTVGAGQLQRFADMRSYLQPVEIQVPSGARVVMGGVDTEPVGDSSSRLVGLLVGQVYRFQVINIPFREGAEVFPTIEVISRLHPPPGLEARFPIPVQITQDELEMALSGRFITRVVYLEDPQAALPRADDPAQQRYFDVGPGQDPLRVADRLGRPMAILRMGSRVPDATETWGQANPPFVVLQRPAALHPLGPEGFDPNRAIERRERDIPRQRESGTELPAPQGTGPH